MLVFWVVAPCSLLSLYRVSEKYTASIFRTEMRSIRKWMFYIGLGGRSGQGIGPSEPRVEKRRWSQALDWSTKKKNLLPNTPHFNPEDRGSMFLRNVGFQPEDYTAQQSRRQPSVFIAVKTSHPTTEHVTKQTGSTRASTNPEWVYCGAERADRPSRHRGTPWATAPRRPVRLARKLFGRRIMGSRWASRHVMLEIHPSISLYYHCGPTDRQHSVLKLQ
jgi:hypothetical protein